MWGVWGSVAILDGVGGVINPACLQKTVTECYREFTMKLQCKDPPWAERDYNVTAGCDRPSFSQSDPQVWLYTCAFV